MKNKILFYPVWAVFQWNPERSFGLLMFFIMLHKNMIFKTLKWKKKRVFVTSSLPYYMGQSSLLSWTTDRNDHSTKPIICHIIIWNRFKNVGLNQYLMVTSMHSVRELSPFGWFCMGCKVYMVPYLLEWPTGSMNLYNACARS